jgi:hypothetical protein
LRPALHSDPKGSNTITHRDCSTRAGAPAVLEVERCGQGGAARAGASLHTIRQSQIRRRRKTALGDRPSNQTKSEHGCIRTDPRLPPGLPILGTGKNKGVWPESHFTPPTWVQREVARWDDMRAYILERGLIAASVSIVNMRKSLGNSCWPSHRQLSRSLSYHCMDCCTVEYERIQPCTEESCRNFCPNSAAMSRKLR